MPKSETFLFHQCYLCFCCGQQYYQICCPSLWPVYYTSGLHQVDSGLAIPCLQEINIEGCQDNFLLREQSSNVQQRFQWILTLQESVQEPSYLEFLELVLNIALLKVLLPLDKLQTLHSLISTLQSRN